MSTSDQEKLDQEECEILEAFESGRITRSKDAANTQERHQKYAEAMFKKDARISFGSLLKIFAACGRKPLLKVFRIKH